MLARPEKPRPDGPRPVLARPERPGAEGARPVKDRPAGARPESGRPERGRPEMGRPERPRPGTGKPERPWQEKTRAGKGKPEKARREKPKAEKGRAEKGRAEKAPEQRVLKTLDRVLSKAGICSRTEASEWIVRGRVRVNSKTVRDPEHWVAVDHDDVVVDGRPLLAQKKIYLLLYKPKGYLTTYKDPDGRPTVYDLLLDVDQWMFPVGRLDQDTSGLLILTNDTDFAEHITNPEFHVPKTYLVKTATLLTDEQLGQLRDGLELKDGMTRPAKVKRVRDAGSKTFFEMTITEGRNRQVRRMVEALGSQVSKLVRVAIGPVRIERLQIGHWRHLMHDEVKALRKSGMRKADSGVRARAGDEGDGGEGHS